MVKEASAVVRTYLDGADIVAWTENPKGDDYVLVPLPTASPSSESRVVALDDALWQIESEIKKAVSRGLGSAIPEFAALVEPDDLVPDPPDLTGQANYARLGVEVTALCHRGRRESGAPNPHEAPTDS